MQTEKQKKFDGLTKGLGELSSYINAVKAATFPGRSLEDGAKLLKFLQDNFKALEKQYSALSEEIRKDVEAESSAVSEE